MSKNITAASNIIPFDFRGESVRAISIHGEPWFVASDVCRILKVVNATQAVQVLDDDERSMFNIGRQGQANIVNESGLYTLILRCRDAVKKGSKPHAFRKWVTAEVLPAIRKHGRHIDENSQMDSLVGAVIGTSGVLVLDRVIEQKASQVPQEQRRSFKQTMKSRLRNRFNVQRTDLIPAEQLADACNFIAAYAIEGEWLPKEEQKKGALTLDQYEVSSLYSFMTHYYHAMQISKHIGLKGTAKLLESKPLMKMEDHLGEASFGFARLDKRRAEIYEIVRRNCGEGGYAMIADGIKPYRSNEEKAA
jgi:prophage antirepressor-like protein